jgi:transposase-like protein
MKSMPITPRSPFKGRQYPGEVILLAVRWYLSCMALRATKAVENTCTSVHLANIQ